MRISSKVECGIIALIDIALNSNGEGSNNIVKVNAISKRNNISTKYLEQIIPLLKQANFLRSVKGAGGGYVMARDPANITLDEVVNALDNTILSSSVSSEKLEPVATAAIAECLWDPVNDYLRKFSEKLTLKDLTDKYCEMQNEQTEPMYYI